MCGKRAELVAAAGRRRRLTSQQEAMGALFLYARERSVRKKDWYDSLRTKRLAVNRIATFASCATASFDAARDNTDR